MTNSIKSTSDAGLLADQGFEQRTLEGNPVTLEIVDVANRVDGKPPTEQLQGSTDSDRLPSVHGETRGDDP
jgi:hypothetical protein